MSEAPNLTTDLSAPGVSSAPTEAAPSRWIHIARAVALGFALLLMGVVLFGILLQYRALLQLCPESTVFCAGLMPGNLRGVLSSERTLAFFAAFRTVQDLLVRGVFWAVALLLIWQRPTQPVALLTAFIFLASGNTGGLRIATAAFPPLAAAVTLALLLIYGGLALLFCLFPNGRFVPRRSGWLALVWWALLLSNWILPVPPFDHLPLWFPGSVLLFFLTFQIYRYRRVGTSRERRQMRWAVFGFAVFLGGFAVISLLGWTFPRDRPLTGLDYFVVASHSFFACAVPVAMGIAILRDNLFDIDLVINRTLVYGVLTAFVVGAYTLVVGAVGALLRVEGNIVLSLIATGLVAIAFNPLRERLQRGVNRLMYGDRDDPYRALSRLGQRLEAAGESSAMLATTVEAVAQTLKLPYVAIVLKQNSVSGLQFVVAHGTAPVPVIRFPLNYLGELVGELIVAARVGETLNTADQRLLADLARPIGVAAHAFRLTTDLEHARLRIVAEREEARRRLGSDLHDGVGHQLAGLARKAELATNLLERDPTAARVMLAEVTQQLNIAITQVRGLAHQLHPPELELLGLVGALRERAQVQSNFAIRVDAPDSLPPLPTAIETAAYYIALEALTNVEKHAGAKSCHIRLALMESHPPMLELDVTDHGRGLPPDLTNGLGLLSMQARAAEVGGTCYIESNPHGGAQVSVRLPCPPHLD